MHPHRSVLLFWLAALAPFAVMAQLQVALNFDRDRYIMFEPVNATVTLRNDSGNDLDFSPRADGSEAGYLIFEIVDQHSQVVRPLSRSFNALQDGKIMPQKDGKFNPAEGLYLPAGASRTLSVPLQKHFDMQRIGNYLIKARVGHHRLAKDYVSPSLDIEISTGETLWERKTGVPSTDSDTGIRSRTCSVNTFHAPSGAVIYLKIEDAHTVYAVTRLGPAVKGVMPSCDFDSLARLHILLQVAPRLFRYRVSNLSGTQIEEVIYMVSETIPRLHRDPDIGRVMVVGGAVAEEGVDYNLESNATMTVSEIPRELIPTGVSGPKASTAVRTPHVDQKVAPVLTKKPLWKRLIPGL